MAFDTFFGTNTLFILELPHQYCTSYGRNVHPSSAFTEYAAIDYDRIRKMHYRAKLMGVIFGFGTAWLSDSYSGRKATVLIFHFLETFYFTFLYILSEHTFRSKLGNTPAIILSYLIILIYCNEGTRNALILQRMKQYHKKRQQFIIFYWTLVRELPPLIFNMTFIFSSKRYDSHSGIVLCISVVYFIIYYFVQFHIPPSAVQILIVERCFNCIYESQMIRLQTWGAVNKEHWLDHAGPVCSAFVIYQTKAAYALFTVLCPLICYATTLETVHNIINRLASILMTKGKFMIYLRLFGLTEIVTVFMLILNEVLIFPICKSVGLIYTPLQKIGVGYFLLGCSLIVASALESKVDSEMGFRPMRGFGRINLCNNLDCECKVAPVEYPNNTLEIGACSWSTIDMIKIEKREYVLIFDCARYNLKRKAQINIKDSETVTHHITSFGIISRNRVDPFHGRDDKTVDITRASILVYLINNRLSGSLNVTDLKLMKSVTLFVDSNARNSSFTLLGEREYNISYTNNVDPDPNPEVITVTLESGAIYAIWLCETRSFKVKSRLHEIANSPKTNQYNIFIPVLLCALGDSMTKRNLWSFVNNESPEPLRSVCFAFVAFLLHGNVGVFFLSGIESWHRNSNYYSTLRLAFLHMVLLVIFVRFAMTYRGSDPKKKRATFQRLILQLTGKRRRESEFVQQQLMRSR